MAQINEWFFIYRLLSFGIQLKAPLYLKALATLYHLWMTTNPIGTENFTNMQEPVLTFLELFLFLSVDNRI